MKSYLLTKLRKKYLKLFDFNFRNQLCLERSHSLPQSCQSKLSFSPSTVEQNIKVSDGSGTGIEKNGKKEVLQNFYTPIVL